MRSLGYKGVEKMMQGAELTVEEQGTDPESGRRLGWGKYHFWRDGLAIAFADKTLT